MATLKITLRPRPIVAPMSTPSKGRITGHSCCWGARLKSLCEGYDTTLPECDPSHVIGKQFKDKFCQVCRNNGAITVPLTNVRVLPPQMADMVRHASLRRGELVMRPLARCA